MQIKSFLKLHLTLTFSVKSSLKKYFIYLFQELDSTLIIFVVCLKVLWNLKIVFKSRNCFQIWKINFPFVWCFHFVSFPVDNICNSSFCPSVHSCSSYASDERWKIEFLMSKFHLKPRKYNFLNTFYMIHGCKLLL